MDESRAAPFSEHRRDREGGRLVYPVLSRRSGGLSLGVNLFPDAKSCSFDCPYCEVFPPSPAPAPAAFDPRELEAELDGFLDREYPELWAPEPVRDLCLSGDGEPSLSPHLGEAIGVLARARRRRPVLLGGAELVIITNSTGFLVPSAAALLERAVVEEGLVVWAKLDGATEASFRRMSRSAYALADIVSGIASFAARSPVVLQTMLCEADGVLPTRAEAAALADLAAKLLAGGARIRSMQLYTKARPSPEGGTEPIPDSLLAELAGVVAARLPIPVRAYGASGEIGIR